MTFNILTNDSAFIDPLNHTLQKVDFFLTVCQQSFLKTLDELTFYNSMYWFASIKINIVLPLAFAMQFLYWFHSHTAPIISPLNIVLEIFSSPIYVFV